MKKIKMGKNIRSFQNYDGKDKSAIEHQEIETPLELVEELLSYVSPENFDLVLDPCVGPGNMVKKIIAERLANILIISDIQKKHVS